MGPALLLVSALLKLFVAGISDPDKCAEQIWPEGDPRRCQHKLQRKTTPNKLTLEILPGMGWDNIRNSEAGQVADLTFSSCQLTLDNQFVIPDACIADKVNLTVSHKKATRVVYRWLDAQPSDSSSINANIDVDIAHLASVTGSHSDEKLSIRRQQLRSNTLTVQTSISLERYNTSLQPDFPFTREFTRRLVSIAECLDRNLEDVAIYEAQLLVRDFGTHVITSTTAGAKVMREDYIDRTSVLSLAKDNKTSILAHAAELSFFNYHNLTVGSNVLNGNVSETDFNYEQSIIQSTMTSLGGSLMQEDTDSFVDWSRDTQNNMVALDRSGKPIDTFIQPRVLPELSESLVSRVAKIVRKASMTYYNVNTVKGCADFVSPYFNPFANVEDPTSCNNAKNSFLIGGFYQTCEATGDEKLGLPCQKLELLNPMTSNQSCPTGYKAVMLGRGIKEKQISKLEEKRCWLFFTCTKIVTYWAIADYKAYWCSGTNQSAGFMFGGVFTSTTNNPFTNKQSCPVQFEEVTVLEDLTLCLSTHRASKMFDILFGGFFSCSKENPFTGSGSCPKGFSRMMAIDTKNCPIYYCAKGLYRKVATTLNRPPYVLPPDDNRQSEYVFQARTAKAYNLSWKKTAALCAGVAAACLLIVLISWFWFKTWRRRRLQVESRPVSNVTSPKSAAKISPSSTSV